MMDSLFFADVTIYHFLFVAAILFAVGITGLFLCRKNLISILMSIELILSSVNLNFVAFSAYGGNLIGQVFTVFILTVAAAEASIGLAILVTLYRNLNTIDVTAINKLKG